MCRESNTGARTPYTEELAFRDWAPYTFLDGFHGDVNTRGFTNERAFVVQEEESTALEVLLPKGCVTGECAMQAKNSLLLPVESATLKYRCAAMPGSTACFSVCHRKYCTKTVTSLIQQLYSFAATVAAGRRQERSDASSLLRQHRPP